MAGCPDRTLCTVWLDLCWLRPSRRCLKLKRTLGSILSAVPYGHHLSYAGAAYTSITLKAILRSNEECICSVYNISTMCHYMSTGCSIHSKVNHSCGNPETRRKVVMQLLIPPPYPLEAKHGVSRAVQRVLTPCSTCISDGVDWVFHELTYIFLCRTNNG